MDAATRGDGWTFDGNLGLSAPDQLVLGRCDTLVWLDLLRREVWWQVTRRTFWRSITREPLWHGNVERLGQMFTRDWIVWWSIRMYTRRRRQYAAIFADERYAHLGRVRLGSRREVDAWLARF